MFSLIAIAVGAILLTNVFANDPVTALSSANVVIGSTAQFLVGFVLASAGLLSIIDDLRS